MNTTTTTTRVCDFNECDESAVVAVDAWLGYAVDMGSADPSFTGYLCRTHGWRDMPCRGPLHWIMYDGTCKHGCHAD